MIIATFLLLVLLLVATSGLSSDTCPNGGNGNNPVNFYPKAFTPSECRNIIKQMKRTLPGDVDERIDKSVKRTNYFDHGPTVTSPDSKYKWIFQRILDLYAPGESMEKFQSAIDFILLHEFDESGFFDWHVDTKPGDGTDRTDNINVMLSDRSEYTGGVLTVGSNDIAAEQGDCYSYPASFPHKVGDITGGRRHTFIIAMKSRSTTTTANASSNSGEVSATQIDQQRQKYWERAEANHKALCLSNPKESKLHLLYGEFLAALGRPDAEVDAKFADMYASTSEAEQYADNFENQGIQLKQSGREKDAKGYLAMAEMIKTRIGLL